MGSREGSSGGAGDESSVPLWMEELDQHLGGLDIYNELGGGLDAGADDADPTELKGPESQFPLRSLVSSHYDAYRDYVLPIGYRGPESGDGDERSMAIRLVGVAIPDPEVQTVAVVFTNGAYYLLRRPQDAEEQRAFLVDFMPGGHPFILSEADELEVPMPSHRQVLVEALYDPSDVPPNDDDFEAVKDAIILTSDYRAQWREREARHVGELTIAFTEAQQQERPEQQ